MGVNGMALNTLYQKFLCGQAQIPQSVAFKCLQPICCCVSPAIASQTILTASPPLHVRIDTAKFHIYF